MTLLSTESSPLGIANLPKRTSHRYRRKVPIFCFFAVPCLWWIVSTKNTSMTRISRHFSANYHGRKSAMLFCHAWTLPSHSRRVSSMAALPRASAFVSSRFPQERCTCQNSWHGIRIRRSASIKLFMVKAKTTHKWEVGDLVSVLPKGNERTAIGAATNATTKATRQEAKKGEVVAIRGSGWYSIRLFPHGESDNGNPEMIIKCRGTQLQRLAFDINDGQVIPNRNTTTASNIRIIKNNASSPLSQGNENDTLSVETWEDPEDFVVAPPTICDLDAQVLWLEQGLTRDREDSSPVPEEQQILQETKKPAPTEERILRQAAHHATYEKWVVFSDLHCSPATLETCLEVLDIVHETAIREENCGVLFLGDFWHHRGTLRVDCLNAILGALRSWRVPMIMIPGNHDQVTLGGENHGLTPLENAYRVGGVPGPLILSRPTVFRKALFVPHIRDRNAMQAVVASREANEAAALFLHTEIKGALMNDMLVSTQGISPSVFPRHKHVYSGHFHKPHFIETGSSSSSTIEYMGSPYQVSLSEAHQQKQLVVLDDQWECEQRIPLSVGRRHFKISSLEELQRVRIGEELPSPANALPSHDNDVIPVRKGDRIVMSVPSKQQRQRGLLGTEDDVLLKSRVQSLREQGLMVELRESSNSDQQTSAEFSDGSVVPRFEELSPESVWREFLQDAKRRDSINAKDHESLLEVGLEILKDLESSDVIQSRGVQTDLRLTHMSVAGFGPFEDTIEYPLDSRGLVLLRGSNRDCGPDSNGTGKSSLAMATLWALTGSLDARPASDLKVADVVNDNSKTARVTVKGFINDSPFSITRSKTASKGDLIFQLNDIDLTTQSIKETQEIIEEKLGIDSHILTRVAFYGQHGMNELLEATDSKLKEELSIVVPLDLWQQSASIARAKSRQAKKRVDEMEGMIRLRKSDVDALSSRVARAKELLDFKEKGLIEAEERMNRNLMRIQDMLDQSSDSNVEEIQLQLEDISAKTSMLNDLHESILNEKKTHMKPLEDELIQVRDSVMSKTRDSNSFEMDVRANKMSLDSARFRMNQIQEKWSLDLSNGMPSVLKPPEYCPTCKQPLRQDDVSAEAIENTRKAMEIEIKGAKTALSSAEDAYKEASLKSSESLESLHAQEKVFNDLRLNHQKESSKWDEKIQDVQEKLREKRQIQNTLTYKISTAVKESQLVAQREAAKASFNTEKLNVAHAREVYNSLENELETAAKFLKKIHSEKEDEEHKQSILSSVGERLGQRGVQTFLLQNTVHSLQRTAQVYLSYLSDDNQRLELSLDAGDKIVRSSFVRGADGEYKQRPLSTLSGGQWRRCSLALSFAFAELVASTGRLRSSLLVLDEPLTHLDRSGRGKFGELVRIMLGSRKAESPHMSAFQISTAIVILQDLSAEELEESFDGVDTVVRRDGRSRLALDDMNLNP